jgi:hypothetical protein
MIEKKEIITDIYNPECDINILLEEFKKFRNKNRHERTLRLKFIEGWREYPELFVLTDIENWLTTIGIDNVKEKSIEILSSWEACGFVHLETQNIYIDESFRSNS